jgi:uncharacterized protein YjcR
LNRVEEVLNRLYLAININKDVEFCHKYGIKANTLSTWKKRDSLPYEHIENISQSENISMDWLLTGKGSMYLEKDNSFSLENSQNNVESSNINNIHLNNVQDCDINHLSSPLHLASGDINDFCQLIKDYATPKMIEEIKQKLLKIKELH